MLEQGADGEDRAHLARGVLDRASHAEQPTLRRRAERHVADREVLTGQSLLEIYMALGVGPGRGRIARRPDVSSIGGKNGNVGVEIRKLAFDPSQQRIIRADVAW